MDRKAVFLGGTCGTTTWRTDTAIPLLEAAGITYHNPQLAPGAWTPADEIEDMRAKAAAEVLLFVITEETRGVASVGEVSYLIGCGRPLALCLRMLPGEGAEADDLNRGRIFVQAMAKEHGVPVFDSVEDATRHAIGLIRTRSSPMCSERLGRVLADITCGDLRFATDGMKLRIEDASGWTGRWWLIEDGATESDVVRTAFKAALTWEEHELRERFRYRGNAVFGPHMDLDQITRMKP